MYLHTYVISINKLVVGGVGGACYEKVIQLIYAKILIFNEINIWVSTIYISHISWIIMYVHTIFDLRHWCDASGLFFLIFSF